MPAKHPHPECLYGTGFAPEVTPGRSYDVDLKSKPQVSLSLALAAPAVEGRRQPPNIAALRWLRCTLSLEDGRELLAKLGTAIREAERL
jgi:hypothetical protein